MHVKFLAISTTRSQAPRAEGKKELSMKKIMIAVVLATTLGSVSTAVQASDWVKGFWEQQERQGRGG